jgi:hypothetical protein
MKQIVMKKIDKALKLLSFFFLATAVYHVICLLFALDTTSPIWRHALFATLSVPMFYFMYKRPPFFVYLFGALLIQQYYGHGRYLIQLWYEKHEIHWISVIDLVFLSFIFILLVLEKIEKSKIAQL